MQLVYQALATVGHRLAEWAERRLHADCPRPVAEHFREMVTRQPPITAHTRTLVAARPGGSLVVRSVSPLHVVWEPRRRPV